MPIHRTLTVAVLVALPATLTAQIIRDTPPPPTGPDTTVAVTPHDSLSPFDRARLEQRTFEAFRRLNLPHADFSVPNTCDETVGRFCYWYDASKALPKERDTVKVERARLVAELDTVARLVPDNFWVAEQQVRYLTESGRDDEAVTAARGCRGIIWECKTLVGFALHLKGDYVGAGAVYDSALALMGSKDRCEWRDISLLLDAVALGRYRPLPCGDPGRDAFETRTWALARTLYSMKGNDSRTEYFARMTMVHMLEDAPGPYQFGFDSDERELLLRFGWARAWAATFQLPFTVSEAPPEPVGTGGAEGGPTSGGARGVGRGGTPVGSYPPGTKIPGGVPPLVRPPDLPGTMGRPGPAGGPPDARPRLPTLPRLQVNPREGDGVNVVSIEAFPAYRYIPAGFVLADPPKSDSAAWRLQLPPVIGRYAPPYASTLVALEHQKAVFRRGDSAIVVMAYETKDTKAVAGTPIRAALVVTPADSVVHDYAAVRDSAPPAGVFTVRAPYGPLLMSAEVAAPARHAVARARYGIGPDPEEKFRVTLSDLLFYTPYGAFPSSVEQVAPHALHTERVRADEKLGVYWEAYGTDPDGEKMHVSLVVLREGPPDEGGFFRRMTRAISGQSGTPVRVSVDDISARGSFTSSRAIELDISTLSKGAYTVQLEIDVAGQPTLRAEHRIEVVGP